MSAWISSSAEHSSAERTFSYSRFERMFLPGFIRSITKHKYQAITFHRSLQQKEKQALLAQPKTLWLCCRRVLQGSPNWSWFLGCLDQGLTSMPCSSLLVLMHWTFFHLKSKYRAGDVEIDGVCLGVVLRWRWAALENVPRSQILDTA